MKNTIKCPHCGKDFEASEALTHQIEEEVKIQIETKLRKTIEDEKNLEFNDLKQAIEEKNKKIDDFRKQELELREKSRKLEDKEKDLELETQRRIDEEKKKIEEDTAKRLINEHYQKDLEKDKQMSDMRKQIEDLKRISQQGSMQTQGEVGELFLEETLRKLFPWDEISEVKKGERGGDVRQVVKSSRGTICGLIVWERKRTKSWSEGWIKKLKEDMSRDKAQIGAIITEVLPKEFTSQIGEKSSIWITTTTFVEPLAILLRKLLYDVAKERAVKSNKQTQAEEIYDFITSMEFVAQVNRMMEIYTDMKQQITKERAVSEKQWKQREMQVERLITGVGGIYGSMKGIAGNALPEIKTLEISDGLD